MVVEVNPRVTLTPSRSGARLQRVATRPDTSATPTRILCKTDRGTKARDGSRTRWLILFRVFCCTIIMRWRCIKAGPGRRLEGECVLYDIKSPRKFVDTRNSTWTKDGIPILLWLQANVLDVGDHLICSTTHCGTSFATCCKSCGCGVMTAPYMRPQTCMHTHIDRRMRTSTCIRDFNTIKDSIDCAIQIPYHLQ